MSLSSKRNKLTHKFNEIRDVGELIQINNKTHLNIQNTQFDPSQYTYKPNTYKRKVVPKKLFKIRTWFFPDINECTSNPCQNFGTCLDGINSFSCVCDSDHYGRLCENRTYN